MVNEREKLFENQTLEIVANEMAGCEPNSRVDQYAKAEFLLRQTKAQISAAQATEETAHCTKRYTRYMLWSVIILALSALGNFILETIRLCHE